MTTFRKLLGLFDRKQKIHLVILFFMMLVGAGLEVLSVSMMVPLVTVMLKGGGEGKTAAVISMLERLLHAGSREDFIFAAIMILIAVTIIKGLYLIFEYRTQYRFVFTNRFRLQRKMLHAFLSRPYEYYLSAETGEILRVIQNDVIVTFDLMIIILRLATELTISILLTVTVFIISPIITLLTACSMLATVLVITLYLRPIEKKAGHRHNVLSAQTNKWLIQAISGIREVKITRKERYFEKNYLKYGEERILIDRDQAILDMAPRQIIEIVSISVTLAVIALQVKRGVSADIFLPELSAFAMAAVKLLPSTNKIADAINQTSFRTSALDKVLENLTALDSVPDHLFDDRAARPAPFSEKIEMQHVYYRYPNTDADTLVDACLVIPHGKCVGIVGPSGAGKTTAVDVLIGLLHPREGKILLDGKDIQEDYAGWLAHIGYIPQMIFMLDDSIKANVAFGYSNEDQDEERVWQALEDAQLADFVRTLPEGLNTRIGERGIRLSGGQRQRIGIARALYENPDVLIFDEATSSLDNETEKAIMHSIMRLKGRKTMVIIAHRLTTIENCDIVYEVRDRTIRERELADVLNHQPAEKE